MGVNTVGRTVGRTAVLGVLARLAGRAPVRAFVLRGAVPPGDPELLRLSDNVRLVDSPRGATVLLVAGRIPAALAEPAQRVHDEMPHPRATVWWRGGDGQPPDTDQQHQTIFTDAAVVGHTAADADEARDDGDVPGTRVAHLTHALRRVQRELLMGTRRSDADLLPDIDPAPWRGVGPYGQGGTGMTGGVPYGRPMTERAPDRDAIELDQLPVRVGPYFPPFPAGLVLDVALQGDVIQEVAVSASPREVVAPIFARALTAPAPIAMVEVARAREHLRWLAHALRVHGLAALGQRALALSVRLDSGLIAGDARTLSRVALQELRTLARQIERSGVLTWSVRGVGVVSANAAAGNGAGPVARASGVAEDARSDEPVYRTLGFAPVVHAPGDASARWRQRIAEGVQSLELAARAGDAQAWGHGVVEGARGRITHHASEAEPDLYALLPTLLPGLEWGDAVTTVVSLDLGWGGAVDIVRPWTAKATAAASAKKEMPAMDAMHGGHEMPGM